MAAEIEAKCLLGNGICPKTCDNYEVALEVTKKLGVEFDPFLSRLTVVFGDGIFKGINVTHVAVAMSKCAAERTTGEINRKVG